MKLPAGIDKATAGPLFCAGITVFNLLIQYFSALHGIKPDVEEYSISRINEALAHLRCTLSRRAQYEPGLWIEKGEGHGGSERKIGDHHWRCR